MQRVVFQDLGQVSYAEAWEYQEQLLAELVEQKLAARRSEKPPSSAPLHHLLFCEHPHVFTLGKSGSEAHVLLDEQQREAQGVSFYKINRGGDITYHGPGQIVGYPIFDLDHFFTDVHKYVRYLEEAIIRTLATYGIEALRIPDYTGVWLPGPPHRKICAIGVHLKRWVTMHGFAFNVNTDLSFFDHIVPCGIQEEDKTVTSLARELGEKVDIEEVKGRLRKELASLFGFQYVPLPEKTTFGSYPP